MRGIQAKILFPPFISSSPSSSLLLLLLLIVIALLSSSIPAAQCTGGGRPESVEWGMLTKKNFSSQIRANPHLLLMITVPWSGESRSLMKEIAHLVASKGEDLGYLKLMVVYRNSEKFLSDALGASEGITLFYYHHSTSYKYQGRLRAHNILSSVYHLMLVQTEEVPLKPLRTQQDLENFSQSTDKAVILLEFCGWSTNLLRRRNHGDNEATRTEHNNSETVGLFEQDLSGEARGKMTFDKMRNEKGLESETLTCHVENGPADSYLLGRWTNQTDSLGSTNGGDGTDIMCTEANFHKFKSFFLDFMKISRDYFLPPERHRFGLISEKSLLPFLDVGNPDTWLVVVNFSGCSNCSMILHEGDGLRTILQTHHGLVKELDADESLESVFPAKRPSIILFIDRSSGSSKFRGESKSALQILRKFVEDNHLFDQLVGRQDGSYYESLSGKVFPNSWSQIIADHSFQHSVKDSATPKLVKFQDNMAIMITRKGQTVALDATADPQGNSLHSILSDLLNQKKPVVGTKETKLSLLAKEVGFQLLSHDFGVQLAESSPSQRINDESRLRYIDDNAALTLEDQTSTQSQKFNEDCGSNNNILLHSDNVASVNDEKQSEHTNTGTCLQQNQERVTSRESDIKELSTILAKELEDDICTSKGTQDNKDNGGKGVLQTHTCPAKDLEKESPSLENLLEEQNIDQTDLKDISPGKHLAGNDAVECTKSIGEGTSGEWHVEQVPFKGSFFFSDGGYQLLRSLTGGEKMPSLVIVDPVLQHHYVHSEEIGISYSSLASFLKEFINGNLTPYRHTASPFTSSRESVQPPFVNQDFHEFDSIPRVSVNTFCTLIVGYTPCEMGNESNDPSLSQIQNFEYVWKTDVLVLFSTSYCGFCQRMELVMRELYRALKNLTILLKRESKNVGIHSRDKDEDTMTNGLPYIFLMDCTLNDCGTYLKPTSKKELYPVLLLFAAENKTAITYKGDMSVVSIIEFLISHGRNSHHLSRHKGCLWMHSWKGRKNSATVYDESSPVYEGASFTGKKYSSDLNTAQKGDEHNLLPVGSHTSDNLHNVVAGSVLASTDMLFKAVPFDNSTILIVTADKAQGFQGVIINKRINWDVFQEHDQLIEPLKQAPLFYGGPVRTYGLPLVSLAQKPIEGYIKVTSDIYFGNPMATRLAIEGIQSRDQSASDFWFFLGYSSWQWNQLFDELATGAWYLNESAIGNVDWPDIVKLHSSVL